MILLRIAHEEKDKISQIAHFLLKQKLAVDLNIEEDVERIKLEDSRVISYRVHLLTATTKSLLFSFIDISLTEMLPDEILEIYAVPIVHMDFEQKKKLIGAVSSV